MHELIERIRSVASLPPHDAARRILDAGRRRVRNRVDRLASSLQPTYSDIEPPCLRTRVGPIHDETLNTVNGEAVIWLTDRYLEHRFDLLGSGWTHVAHGEPRRGMEGYRYDSGPRVSADPEGRWLTGRINRRNLDRSREIWRLIDPAYEPIDWQVDFKSGFRWTERTMGSDIRYAHLPGVDVKVPWELGRCQHLPQLAVARALASRGLTGSQGPEAYDNGFRNQVLDFAATNPPGFGVQWACTMDVAIRVINWLLARDLLIAHGAAFDAAFESVFRRSVFEHALHISTHLEWDPKNRGNHYLADIIGLLFAAAYLPSTRLTDVWLAFGTVELIAEAARQFHPDGTNFEASTSYHRLSGELLASGVALILGFTDDDLRSIESYDHTLVTREPGLSPAPVRFHTIPGTDNATPLPPWIFERLERAAEFTQVITMPDGHVVLVGDDDSGRAHKIAPTCRRLTVEEAIANFENLHGYTGLPASATWWQEDHLHHHQFVSSVTSIVERRDLGSDRDPITDVMRSLARGRRATASGDMFPAGDITVGTDENLAALSERAASADAVRLTFWAPGAREGLETFAYPDFGLYVIRSDAIHLVVRCGPVGQGGNGGHAHNDQLAITLVVDGEPRVLDPGSYVYTPLPRRRNDYRSVRSHYAPRLEGREPAPLDRGLFHLPDTTRSECLYFGGQGFAGRHRGYGFPIYRIVRVHEDAILIFDWSEESGLRLAPLGAGTRLSVGYGVLSRTETSWQSDA